MDQMFYIPGIMTCRMWLIFLFYVNFMTKPEIGIGKLVSLIY